MKTDRPLWTRNARDRGKRITKQITPASDYQRERGADLERQKAAFKAEEAHHSSDISWDRQPSGNRSGLVFSRAVGGRFSANPAHDVSGWLRSRLNRALSGQRRPDCTVYDAAGKPIAIIDGETRERRPL